MLTESAYFWAIAIYCLSAVAALALVRRWMLRRLRLSLQLLILLPLAALLLTPAYIAPEAETLAPALVVGVFQLMTAGMENAVHAFRPLAVFTAAAFALGLLLSAVSLMRGRG
jgi:hypothetical protein